MGAQEESPAAPLAGAGRLPLALEAAGDVGTWSWDPAADRLAADASFWSLHGRAPAPPHDGEPERSVFLACVAIPDRQAVSSALDQARETGGAIRVEYRIASEADAPRWILLRGSWRRLETGETLLLGIAVDVSEQHQVEAALRETEERYEAITNSIDQMIWSTRPDGFHDYFNKRWYEFTGVPEGSTDGDEWNGMFHPDDQDRAWAVWRHSLATGDPYHIEYRLRHRSGQYRWVIGRAQCVRDAEGRIVRWYGTCTDIHVFKEAEAARELIARELSHRIKNIFAVVTSLVLLPTRERPEHRPFAQDVQARIAALATAHEYVRTHSADSGPPETPNTIHGLLRVLTSPYEIAGQPRILIGGSDAAIGTRAGTALALLVHELSTNAVKYGALARDGGSVDLATTLDQSALTLTWSERGGPAVSGEPERRGFGTTLSEKVVAAQLGATIDRAWRPSGLVVTISISLEQLAS